MAEDDLNYCDTLLNQVFEVNPLALMLFDIKGKIIRVNPQVEELTGYKYKDLEGKFVYQLPFWSKDNLPRIKDKCMARLEGRIVKKYDADIYSKDGKKIVGSILGQLIKDGKGNIIGSLVIIEDVTEQRKSVEDLKKLHKQTEQYLDVSGSMVVVLGKNGEIILINRMGLELLGYSKKEIFGKNWFDVAIPKEILNDTKKLFSDLMNTKTNQIEKKTMVHQNEILTKDGNRLIIIWHFSLLIGENGEINGIVNSGIDATLRIKAEREARKKIEQLEQMNRVVVGRELKMIELKEKIAKLEKILEKIYDEKK